MTAEAEIRRHKSFSRLSLRVKVFAEKMFDRQLDDI